MKQAAGGSNLLQLTREELLDLKFQDIQIPDLQRL